MLCIRYVGRRQVSKEREDRDVDKNKALKRKAWNRIELKLIDWIDNETGLDKIKATDI